MIDAGSLEFAHARIGARLGAQPDAATWHRLETTRDLAGVLEIAHGSGLAGWVEGLGPGSDLHALEGRLRRRWHERVVEVASWMPAPWQPAIAWCATLIDLPLLQRAARGDALPAWAADDERLRRPDPATRSLLAAARQDPGRLLDAWRASFVRRLPPGAAARAVERDVVAPLAAHAAAFASRIGSVAIERRTVPGPSRQPPGAAADGPARRRELTRRLAGLLRRCALQPSAAFVWLALQALELERLRGELATRAAFPHRVPGT